MRIPERRPSQMGMGNRRRNSGRLVRGVAAVLMACACAFALVHAALAKAPEGQPLEVSGPAEVQLGFLDVRPLPFIAEPESIEVGITCGMDWMCGQDPCLCGSSDAWGACSCNGLQEVRPTFALAASDGSQLGFVHLVKAFDRVWLVSAGAGEANALLTAELVHYAPASVKVHISSAPFGLVDVLKLGVVALAAAGIVALVRLAVIRALGAFRALKRRKERI